MEEKELPLFTTLNNKIKSNPYVYPYVPFFDLSKKDFRATFSRKTLPTKDVAKILKALPTLNPKLKGQTTAEKVFSLFLDNEVLFGPKEYVNDAKKEWIKQFNYFITKKRPIQMTILGFPFKMPIPLKTDRTLPDMGELLSLKRLYDITLSIKTVYPPGAIITIVTEGVFGKFNHISKIEYDNYALFLNKMIKEFGFESYLKIVALEDMEKLSKNFKKQFAEKVNTLESQYKNNNSELLKKYNGAKESIYRIVNTKRLKIPIKTLMNVYNEDILEKNLSRKEQVIRKTIEKELHSMLISYLAYLMVRDDLNFIERMVPHAITLSVSPKPNRLGIIPVASHCIRLPYHGVPIYHPGENKFTIEYLIDIVRSASSFRKIYWENDKERKPFFYVKQ